MDAADLARRLKSVKKKRPLLMNVPMEELEQYIREQVKEREIYYLQADHIIDGPVDDLTTLAALIKGFQR
jgi:hypothetical protein